MSQIKLYCYLTYLVIQEVELRKEWMAGSDIMSIIITKTEPKSDVQRVLALLLLKHAYTHVASCLDYMPKFKL